MSLHKLRSKEMRCMRNLEDALQDCRESGSHASGIGDANKYCACIHVYCMYIYCTYALQHTRNINYGHLWSSMDNNILTIISLANTLCSRMVILYHFWYLALLEPDALTLSSYRKKCNNPREAPARLPAMSKSERFWHHQVMAIPGGSRRKVCTMRPGRLASSTMLAGPFFFTYKLLQEPPGITCFLVQSSNILKACFLFAPQLMPAAHLFKLAGYRQRSECPARTTYILWTLLT